LIQGNPRADREQNKPPSVDLERRIQGMQRINGQRPAHNGIGGPSSTSQITIPLITAPLRPQYLNLKEVAALLRIRPSTVYQMVHKRRIPFRKAGRQLLFDLQEIDTWTKINAEGDDVE
jgi:excisionase family DNA binding protein